MKRFRKKIGAMLKRQKSKSSRYLIMNRGNNTQDGLDQADSGWDNHLAQTPFSASEDQLIHNPRGGPLAEVLEPQDRLIQESVSQHFPEPPVDLEQNLQQHLLNVQETMCNDMARLGPRQGLKGLMIEYHRHLCDHLNDLVEKIHSFQNCLVLMKWVMNTYRSLLCRPDLQEMDPIKVVDLLPYSELVAKAKDKLLEKVRQKVRGSLEKILQIEESQEGCCSEEACIALYVDTIQCIESIPAEALKISSKLSSDVQEICHQELLTFVGRYTTVQTGFLGKKAKMDELETIHIFKTLKACKEIKQYVQTSQGITRSPFQETVAKLDNLEAFTSNLLRGILSKIAESLLKDYFKTRKEHCLCISEVGMHFPKLLWCQDVQRGVMDEAYKLIAHIYLKHLVQSSRSNLNKFWGSNVGQKVTEDAELLHNTFSELAPGVQQWNLMLLKITELLECKSAEESKVTAAIMQKECLTWRQDKDLLPALLRWKGLSKWEVLEVLDAIPGQQSRPRSASWYSCITCL